MTLICQAFVTVKWRSLHDRRVWLIKTSVSFYWLLPSWRPPLNEEIESENVITDDHFLIILYYIIISYYIILYYTILNYSILYYIISYHFILYYIIQPKGLQAESVRAVTGRPCPHSGIGEDFLTRLPGFFFKETAITRKRKVKKSIQRWQINRLAEGYKQAINENRSPIAKKSFWGQNPDFWA